MNLPSTTTEDFTLNYIIITRDDKIEKKCTLHPHRSRPDFDFRTRMNHGEFSTNSILLFPDGETLTKELAKEIIDQFINNSKIQNLLNIVLIDTRWKKTKWILESLPQLRRVSLVGFVTGALRKDPPPPGGLASVEALYLTSFIFGKPDHSLLENYHFRNRFLKLNALDL